MYRREFSNFAFAYWLQGALEISAMSAFSDTQVQKIKRRLSDIPEFNDDLKFVLGSITEEQILTKNLSAEEAVALKKRKETANEDTKYAMQIWFVLGLRKTDEAFAMINTMQQSIFIHDIDPTYEGDQDYFHAVHRGEIDPEDKK
jgi:hypothetical protein